MALQKLVSKFSPVAFISGTQLARNVAIVLAGKRELAISREEADEKREFAERAFRYFTNAGGITRSIRGRDMAVTWPMRFPVPGDGAWEKKFGLPQAVGVHVAPFELQDAFASGADLFRVCLRSVVVDDSEWRARLESAAKSAPAPMAEFLNLCVGFYGQKPGFARRLVIWGPAISVLQSAPGAVNVLAQADQVLNGVEIEAERAAQVLHQRVDPRRFSPMLSLVADQVLLRVRGDYYQTSSRVSGNSQFHAMWNVAITEPAQLRALTQLPFDLDVQFENVNDPSCIYWYCLVSAGAVSLEQLNQYEETMRMILNGRVARIRFVEAWGQGLMETLFARMVGSSRRPAAPRISMPNDKWRQSVAILSEAPNEAASGRAGSIAFGTQLTIAGLASHTVTIDPEVCPVVALVGESGSGKSVLAQVMSMQTAGVVEGIPMFVFVHHSTSAKEFAGELAERMGGTYLNPDLPIVRAVAEYEAARASIDMEVDRRMELWKNRWSQLKKPVGMPFVMRINSGSEALGCYYLERQGEALRKLLTWAGEKFGWRYSWVDDDLAGLPANDVRDNLGDITANNAKALRHRIFERITYMRKQWGWYAITIQSPLAFNDIHPSAWGMIPMAILLHRGRGHNVAAVVTPKAFTAVGFDVPKAAAALSKGHVDLPPGVEMLFSPFIPPTMRRILGVN